jgi:ABC-type transporter Mla MlaB component
MFRIDSVRTPGARRLLVLTGDLGTDARDELVRAVEGALNADGAIELDLGDVTSIDRAVICYLAQLRGPTVGITRAPAYVARWLGAEGRR